jgi:hypothetical protein
VQLPLLIEVLCRIQGFTFEVSLDLNCCYGHFSLDANSKAICGIALPYDAIISRNSIKAVTIIQHFPGTLAKVFCDFNDVVVYADNIILFINLVFEHSSQHLGIVLERIKKQKLNVQNLGTFLAAKEDDYLGYNTLCPPKEYCQLNINIDPSNSTPNDLSMKSISIMSSVAILDVTSFDP